MDERRKAFIEKLKRLNDGELSKVEGWLAMNGAKVRRGARRPAAAARKRVNVRRKAQTGRVNVVVKVSATVA